MREEVLSLLPPDHPWRDKFVFLPEVVSTNDEAKRLAEAGAPHGTAVLAGYQTGGRGRRGRTFQSPPGLGMYLSVILRPGCKGENLMHLTCAMALAVMNGVKEAAGIMPQIKWINDLVYENRKLGGILTEVATQPDGEVAYAIVGIGINCLQTARDFLPDIREMATSLRIACNQPISPGVLAANLLITLCETAEKLLTEKREIMKAYEENCITLGKEVQIIRGDTPYCGFAVRLDENGGLVIKNEKGTEETVNAGEVSVRGLYGYL